MRQSSPVLNGPTNMGQGQLQKLETQVHDLAQQVHELQVEVAVNRVRIPGYPPR